MRACCPGRVLVTVFQQYSERTHMCFHDLYCNLAKVVFHLKLLDFFGKGQRSIRRKTNITQAPGRDIKTIRYQSLSLTGFGLARRRAEPEGRRHLGKKPCRHASGLHSQSYWLCIARASVPVRARPRPFARVCGLVKKLDVSRVAEHGAHGAGCRDGARAFSSEMRCLGLCVHVIAAGRNMWEGRTAQRDD